MAAFTYEGNTYFYANGKWMDCQSRQLKKELADRLNQAYSRQDIQKKEKEQKQKKGAGQRAGGVSDVSAQGYAYQRGFGGSARNPYNVGNAAKTTHLEQFMSPEKSKKAEALRKAEILSKKESSRKPESSKNLKSSGGSRRQEPGMKPGTHRKATEHESSYRKPAELTEDQKRALKLLESGRNIFLSGEAGTGKSFVLNEYINRNKTKNMIICAPTGIAAINIGGSTLHRVFNVPISPKRPGDCNMKPDNAVIKADVIIIDEISMCRFDIFEYVIRTIQNAEQLRQNKADTDAFSGGQIPQLIPPKQVIVVGDFFQLAPVITSKDKEILEAYWDMNTMGEGFAFQSPLWAEMDFQTVVLKEIVRQRGSDDYITNLNKIRSGDATGIRWFNETVGKEPIPNSIYLCGTNRAADEINQKESDALPGEEVVYQADIDGEVQPSDKLTQDVLALKVGMQVMTLVNDVEEGYQNGSLGKVTSLRANEVDVRLNNGKSVTVKVHDWEVLGYEIQEDKLEKIVLGNFKQIPLKIAYAITIHKSQGQTYSSANISPQCFASGQLYVALSRVQSIEGMSLKHDILRSSLKTSRVVREFYDEVEED